MRLRFGCSVLGSAALAVALMLGTFTPAGAGEEAQAALRTLQEAFVDVAQSVKPAVVNIATTQKPRPREGRRGQQLPPSFRGPFEEFFDRFFGEQQQRERHSLGSGVLMDSQGHILTNNHVIEQADQIEVRLSDKRKFQAKVIGKDPKTDLAVIKIDNAGDLPAVRLGDSDRIRTGEWAIAIGNPFGLTQTVTVGVISAVGRADVGITTYEDFIQTDASINPGNSGGPLVNLAGEVIGINTAIVASGQGIGFAIPINMARQIAGRLIAQGKIVRGWLGIGIQELTDELGAQFGVKAGEGVLVGNVMKGSPAEKADLKPGDIIHEFKGVKITGVRQLQLQVADSPANSQATVKVLRDKQPLTLTVTLGEQPADLTVAAQPPGTETAERFGLTVQELTPELREQFKLPAGAGGLVVAGVEEGGPAAREALRPGDLIIQVNREPVRSLRDFARIVGQMQKGSNLLLLVQREGNSRFVVLAPRD
ncbi:MAG: DegQ family serine endoprotease [candidate division NC10 bacterium]|nr:DegQ family serine endoprotease [candidate division NC10 bacterium]